MKQGLQLKFSQNLSLTPQLQQAIKLLQLSTLELNQEIDLLMQTNPLLERGDDGEDEYGNATDNSEDEITLNTASNDGNATETSLNDETNSDFDVDKASGEFSDSNTEPIQTEPTEFEQNSTDYSAEFNDEYDEFSNGSLWDENNTPSDDDSDFKQQ
jgi:RNA polymerase sigma-54 factor